MHIYRIRVLRYNPGDNFHPHLDGSYISEDGDRSYMSVQVYLNQVSIHILIYWFPYQPPKNSYSFFHRFRYAHKFQS